MEKRIQTEELILEKEEVVPVPQVPAETPKPPEKSLTAKMTFFLPDGREESNTLTVKESHVVAIRENLIKQMENPNPFMNLVIQGTQGNTNDFCIIPSRNIVAVKFQVLAVLQ